MNNPFSLMLSMFTI